jgi:hypothetical protein
MDSFIYWGNAAHSYSPASMTALPGAQNTVAAAADLDQNGYVDIVFPNGRIYWNGPQGFSIDRRLDLDVERGNGVTVADLNRDGYLDLIFSAGGAHVPGSESTGFIYWGSRSGYRPGNRTALKLDTRITLSPRAADLNKDGFLDLIFPDVDSETLDIVWGDASGRYSMDRKTRLAVQSAASIEIADLNGDGWLDLILGGGWDRKRFGRPTREATLLWGSPTGFSPERATHLEAFDSLDQAVADLNKDGYLDIVMTNYHAYTTRTLPAFIYWGGPGGAYSESRRTSLAAESSSAVTVADFNQDGWLDLVVFNHVASGDHSAGANIFWGGKEGYSYGRQQWVPTFGPHFSLMKDIGNIYHRRIEEEYLSPPLECPAGTIPARLGWKARTPNGTAVKFQIRTAPSKAALAGAEWRGPQGPSTYYERSDSRLALRGEHAWLQYRAVFISPDGGSTSFLEQVYIDTSRESSGR